MQEKTDYQIFLNYRGADVRQGLVDCLHHVMTENGLRVFIGMEEDEEDCKNEEEMEEDTLDDDILQAINHCRVYIPIFSKYYASNKFCLQELAAIVESSRCTVDKMVFPILYDVTAHDFLELAMDFIHKEEKKIGSHTAQRSEEALREVQSLEGWDLKDTSYIEFSKLFTREVLIKFNTKVIENLNEISGGLSAATEATSGKGKGIEPEVLEYSYDVFFSFRGSDTRQPFVHFLGKSMKKVDICFFKYNPVLITREDLEKRWQAINNSEFCVPILSKTYASSLWCLLELDKMVQSGKKIIPVFYGVRPSTVRLETEVWLRVHRENLSSEIVSQWERVLQNVAQIKGWEFKDDRTLEFSKYFAEQIFVNLPETQDDQANKATIVGKEAHCSERSINDYEVFLSFRGADTREELADHLYHHLLDAGIRVFRNDNELPIVKKMDTLSQVIKTCKICIPVFSATYVSSKWCLRELARMVEYGKEILPIFYGVEPGAFKLGMDSYQLAKDIFSFKEVQQWKKALGQVIDIKGWKLEHKSLGDLSLITREVLLSIKAARSVAYNLVGMNGDSGTLKDIMNLLDVEAHDVRCIGICGKDGTGKTTLAKVVFNKLSDRFDGCSFLANIKTSLETIGLPYLREQLILDLLGDQIKYSHKAEGNSITMAERELLRQQKVLIVLDDVEGEKQIEELLEDFRHRFGLGSRVIVTTRNKEVVVNRVTIRWTEIYEMDELSSDQALELSNMHAFESLPLPNHLDLAKRVIYEVGGLPLAIEIIGSFLCRRSLKLWEQTSKKLAKLHHQALGEILMMCYEELEDSAKQIFLDIACFFADREKTNAIYMWEACDLLPGKGIKALLSMSLIKITEDNRFWMHDLVRKFGREIVLNENRADPKKRSRVWQNGEASSSLESIYSREVLDEAILDEAIDYLYLNSLEAEREMLEALDQRISEHDDRSSYAKVHVKGKAKDKTRIHQSHGKSSEQAEIRSNMREEVKVEALCVRGCNKKIALGAKILPNLRFLELSEVDKDVHEISCLPANLKWLSWRSSKLDFTIFMIDNLVVLDLSRSKWRQEMFNFKELKGLKALDLSYCVSLTDLPPLSRFKSLERLILEGCERLAEIDSSIGCLLSLKYLNIRECYCLRGLPEELSSLTNLTEIVMKGNGGPFRVPEAIGKLKSLTILEITDVQIISGLPESIGELKRLKKMSLFRCSGIDELPESLGRLHSLVELDISHTYITELPESIGNLKELKQIKMECCSSTYFPSTIGSMEKLEELYAKGCTHLRELPESIGKLSRLRILDLSDTGIRGFPKTISWLSFLDTLCLERCHDLQEIPELPTSLKRLYFTSSRMQRLPKLSNLHSLTDVVLCNATDLESHDTNTPKHLESLEATDVMFMDATDRSEQSKLQFNSRDCPELFPELVNLNLSIQNITSSSLPLNLGIFPNLKTLTLSCGNLQFCPQLPSSLSKLVLQFLSPQTELFQLSNLQNLLHLEFDECEMTEDILGSLELDKISLLELLYIKGCSFRSLRGLHLPSNLKILCMNNNAFLSELPHLQGLNNLRQLSLLDCPNVSLVAGLGELASLQELTIRGFHELEGLPELSSLAKLEVLRIEHCKRLCQIEGLRKLGSLQQLFISGCDSLTDLDDLWCLTNLRIVELKGYKGIKHIDKLEKLHSLQELFISGFDSLKSVGSFMSLEILKISGCNGVKEINYLKNLQYSLKELFISGCDSLKRLGGLRWLQHLRVVKIDGCKGLEEINDLDGLGALQELFISGCDSLRNVCGLCHLRHLRVVKIYGCKQLRNINFDIGILNSLQELFISGCDSLIWLKIYMCVDSVRVMKIDDCKGLTEISCPYKSAHLQELFISGCDSFKRLEWLDLPCLRVMKINGCKGLEEINVGGKLDSLQELFISGCDSLKRLWSFSSLDSLMILKVNGCKWLEEINGLMMLKSLRELSINGCDSLQHLPDLSKLNELRVLHIGGCEKLRHIDGLPRLSSLRDLQIHGCPSLQSILDELKPMKRSHRRTIRGIKRKKPTE